MIDRIIDILKEVFLWAIDMAQLSVSAKTIKLFNTFLGGMNEGLTLAFSNPIVNAFLQFASYVSWSLFIIFLCYYFLKIGKEERRNWYAITMTPLTTIFFITFNQIIAKLCFLLPNLIIDGFTKVISPNIKPGNFFSIGKVQASLWLSIAILIAAVGFFLVSVIRLGSIFIQMLIAPFYVPSLLSGDTQKAMEWITSTIAVGFTYLVQFVVFYSGALLLSYNEDDTYFIWGIVFLICTFLVPKALQKWGWNSGISHSFQSAYSGISALSMGFRMLK